MVDKVTRNLKVKLFYIFGALLASVLSFLFGYSTLPQGGFKFLEIKSDQQYTFIPIEHKPYNINQPHNDQERIDQPTIYRPIAYRAVSTNISSNK